jgi:hypothetical protein
MTKKPTDDVAPKTPKPKPHDAMMKLNGKARRAENHKGNKVQPAHQKRTGFKGR